MQIIQIAGIALATMILVVSLKQQKPEFAMVASIAGGILILWMMAGELFAAIQALRGLSERVQVDGAYLTAILKVIGISYVTEFAAQTCRDVGENALAAKVELGGKALLLAMAVPILSSLLELMLSIIP